MGRLDVALDRREQIGPPWSGGVLAAVVARQTIQMFETRTGRMVGILRPARRLGNAYPYDPVLLFDYHLYHILICSCFDSFAACESMA